MSSNEEILIEGVKRRDRAAQRALYDRYAGGLLYTSIRYVARRDVVEDILHDAFIKIFHSIDSFKYRGDGSIRAWMERITINTALEWLRKSRRLDLIPLNSELSQHNISDELSCEETERIAHESLMKLVAELPDGYRTIFNLFCVEGYSHREIAEMMGINEKSSSSQLLRAKRLLAKRIRLYIENNE